MIKGRIYFERAEIGSRSEWVYPFIELDDGESHKILVEDENPFESATLRQLEGKIVEAEGEFSDSGAFIATEVREIVDIVSETVEEPCEIEENKEKTEETVEISEETEEKQEEN